MNRPRRKKDGPTKSNKRTNRYPPIELPPLSEQEERIRMIKKRRTKPTMKMHLTKKQRRYSSFPINPLSPKGIGGPENYRKYRL